ncbi:MAG: Glyoxalase-like domain [Thermoleophilia bacterium]|nr:Glyoxalase-like domain [Thermoleophilia bacterium]
MALETPVPRSEATGSAQTLVAGVAFFSVHPERLVKFYELLLRVTFKLREHEDGRHHWVASLGGVQFEIKALRTVAGSPTTDAAGTNADGVSRGETSFQVAGVAGAAARAMVNGGRIVSKAEAFDWGTFAVVLDPDGNRVGLFEPPTKTSSSTEGTA